MLRWRCVEAPVDNAILLHVKHKLTTRSGYRFAAAANKQRKLEVVKTIPQRVRVDENTSQLSASASDFEGVSDLTARERFTITSIMKHARGRVRAVCGQKHLRDEAVAVPAPSHSETGKQKRAMSVSAADAKTAQQRT